MLNNRLAAAQNVAAELFPAEQHIEDALVGVSRLAIAIVEGRQTAKLPISAGQESLSAVSEVAAALVDARGKIAAAHASLAQDKVNIGLGTRAMGDWGECPPAAISEPVVDERGLRLVG